MYADIAMEDYVAVKPVVRQQNKVRCNLAGTRCIIKWNGGLHKCMEGLDLNFPPDQSKALEYYSNPVNGWIDAEETY